VAGRDGDRLDPALAAGGRDVDRVLEEHDRVVVGEGDARTVEGLGRLGDRLGRRRVRERVDLARLRDVPVLTEAARQVAPGGPEREHRASRQEVIERLLLDRVDAEAARAPVAREHDLAVLAGADEAEAALALPQLAGARADVALDPAVVEAVPVAGGNG